MTKKQSLASKVGWTAWAAKDCDIEQWGRLLIENLRKQGIYINQARGDAAGRRKKRP